MKNKDYEILQNQLFEKIKNYTKLNKEDFKAITQDTFLDFKITYKQSADDYSIEKLKNKYIYAMKSERKSEQTIAGYKLQMGLDTIQILLGHEHITTTQIYAETSLINAKLQYDKLIA